MELGLSFQATYPFQGNADGMIIVWPQNERAANVVMGCPQSCWPSQASNPQHLDNAIAFAHRKKDPNRRRKKRTQTFAQFNAFGRSVEGQLLVDGARGSGDGVAVRRVQPKVG